MRHRGENTSSFDLRVFNAHFATIQAQITLESKLRFEFNFSLISNQNG